MSRSYRPLFAFVLLILSGVTRADERTERIGQGALRLNDALFRGSYDEFVALTYPRVVEMSGGRTNLIKLVRSETESLEAEGITHSSCEILSVSPVYKAGSDLHAVVRLSNKMRTSDATITQRSFLLAVSGDGGATWSYVGGSNVSVANIKLLFPKFNDELKFPAEEEPAIEYDK